MAALIALILVHPNGLYNSVQNRYHYAENLADRKDRIGKLEDTLTLS